MICTEIIDSYRNNSVAGIQRFGGKLLKGVGLLKERTTSMRKDCWIRWKDSSFSCHFSALNSITCRLWWDLRKAIQLHAMQFLLNAWRLNDGSGLPVLVTGDRDRWRSAVAIGGEWWYAPPPLRRRRSLGVPLASCHESAIALTRRTSGPGGPGPPEETKQTLRL